MDPGATIALDFSSPHVIIILIILIFILVGMGSGMIWNLIKTLREDKEEIAASKNTLADRSGAASKAEDPELPTVVPPHPSMKAPTSSSYSRKIFKRFLTQWTKIGERSKISALSQYSWGF